MPISRKFSLSGSLLSQRAASIKDKVSVKDSTIYQFQKWDYLVKRKNLRNGEDELLMLLEELAEHGWELINSQPVNLGFYIFKKLSK